jgi:hypothetical protein
MHENPPDNAPDSRGGAGGFCPDRRQGAWKNGGRFSPVYLIYFRKSLNTIMSAIISSSTKDLDDFSFLSEEDSLMSNWNPCKSPEDESGAMSPLE